MINFSGKRILVTGAASGIGRSTCYLLDELGATVIGLDVDEPGLESIPFLKGRIVRALRPVERIPAIVGQCCDEDLWGLVHAAGLPCVEQVRLLEPRLYRDALLVNAEAALALARAFLRCSRPGGGSIVFVSSVLANVGAPGAAGYAMTKGALQSMARVIALEVAPRRIRVNCVAPGFVETPMTHRTITAEQLEEVAKLHPLGIGEASDIAGAIAFLLSDSAKWITGSVLVADGGYTAR